MGARKGGKGVVGGVGMFWGGEGDVGGGRRGGGGRGAVEQSRPLKGINVHVFYSCWRTVGELAHRRGDAADTPGSERLFYPVLSSFWRSW